MEEILKLINELPVEQLQSTLSLIDKIVEPRVKVANSEVKLEKVHDSKWLSYNGRSIIVQHSKYGYNIYNTVVGKSGKLIKGDLIETDSSLNIWEIRNRFRMNRI
jgi:hypothetical protein